MLKTGAKDRAELLELAEAVDARFGLKLHDALRATLGRVAQRLVEGQEAPDVRGVIERLRSAPDDDPAVRALREAASVTETYFFRDPAQLSALVELVQTKVLPRKREAGSNRLRIWSAACATGEETYTLAGLFREAAPDFEVQVLGTDMNDAALEVAREGVYGAKSFRRAHPERHPELLRAEGDRWRVPSAARRGVQFRRLNLMRDPYPLPEAGLADFDVLVCRNVLIYLDPKDLAGLMRNLTRTLAPQSVLVLAPAEYGAGAYAPEFRHTSHGILFREGCAETGPLAVPAPEGPGPLHPPTSQRGNGTRSEAADVEALLAEVRRTADLEGLSGAERKVQELLAKTPDSPWPYLARGQVQLALGDASQACRFFRGALFLAPELVAAELGLGQALLKERRRSEAELHFQRVDARLAESPEDAPVLGLGMNVADVRRLVRPPPEKAP